MHRPDEGLGLSPIDAFEDQIAELVVIIRFHAHVNALGLMLDSEGKTCAVAERYGGFEFRAKAGRYISISFSFKLPFRHGPTIASL